MSDVITLPGTRPRTPFDQPTPAQREAFLGTLQETARLPRYAPTVMVHARQRGTEVLYFAINPAGRHFANIAGRPDKALTARHLHEIEGLGFRIEHAEPRV